jgi:hypothetical protein
MTAMTNKIPFAKRKISDWGALMWRPLTLALFATWLLLIGSHHEPWFDEAQAWLLARDNGLWTLLAERVRYEGSPGLWHAILWLAIRGGLPFSGFFLLPAAFALAGAAVVLWRAPFHALLRVGVLASYFFGFQYSVVARSYSLDLLLIPLAAVFFETRLDRPFRYALIVGLIANANAQGFVAAGALGIELAWQVWQANRLAESRCYTALLLAGGLGLFAMWTAWQPEDNSFLASNTRPNPMFTFIGYFRNAFIYRLNFWTSAPQGSAIYLSSFLSVGVFWTTIRLVMAGRNRILLLSVLAAIIGLALIVYADRWGSGVLFLFWLFILWVEWGSPISVALRCEVVSVLSFVCLIQSADAIRSGFWDFDHVYSPGQQVAKAVTKYRENHLGVRIAGYGFKAFEVQPWFSGNLFVNYYHGANRPSYVVWANEETWPIKTNLVLWQQTLASKPDLIVASRVGFTGQPENIEFLACRMGYDRGQIFPGATIWHGVAAEDATLYLYERGSTNNCNADRHGSNLR